MGMNNPPYDITLASVAILASATVAAAGITTSAQCWYGSGAGIYVPGPDSIPAVVLQRGKYSTRITGFDAGGAGARAHRGVVYALFHFSASIDEGTIDAFGSSVADDLIDQGGVNFNVIDAEVTSTAIPNAGLQATVDANQPGTPNAPTSTILLALTWED